MTKTQNPIEAAPIRGQEQTIRNDILNCTLSVTKTLSTCVNCLLHAKWSRRVLQNIGGQEAKYQAPGWHTSKFSGEDPTGD